MAEKATEGPAPWESKEVLTGLITIIGYIALKTGVELSPDELLALGTALVVLFRLFASQGPIAWARLFKRG